MKNLTLIAHADIKQALADTLRGLELVSEFTFTQVESHSVRDEFDTALSARDSVIGYTPHVRVDILLKGDEVDAVLQALRAADCGLEGRAIYQVTTVEKQGAL
jgi:nitrogen regulatory protein P-II 1